jgi:hypothetical protein
MSGALGAILSGTGAFGAAGGTAYTLLSPLTGTGVNALSQALGPNFPLSWIRQPRALGSGLNAIIPDVTIEEHFIDRVTATVHPLATGTPITDHIFRQPHQLTMKLGWTNANPLVGAVQGALQGVGGTAMGLTPNMPISATGLMGGLEGAGSGALASLTEERAANIYQQLLNLQFNEKVQPGGVLLPAIPFNVTAGKRTYKNMVIIELNATNTAATEYALIIDVTMQEVMMVTAPTPNLSAQAASQKTGGVTSTGNNNATPTSSDSSQTLGGSIMSGLKWLWNQL